MPLNKKTWCMEPPIHPCYKGEGLCDRREFADSKFECVYQPSTCRCRHITKPETQKKETEKLWDGLGRKSPENKEVKSE